MKKELLYIQNMVAYRNRCVLNNISFTVFQGEVFGIVGHHGSGLSLLINILEGKEKEDKGSLFWKGRRIHLESITDANHMGIYRVNPSNMLIENLDVAENLVLMKPAKVSSKVIHKRAIRTAAQRILDKYGVVIDVCKKTYMLNNYERNVISIIKVIERGAKLLILNNSIPYYTWEQRRDMKNLLTRVTSEGISIILESAELDGVIDMVDRILVLCDGMVEGLFLKEECDLEVIEKLMKSHFMSVSYICRAKRTGQARMALTNMKVDDRYFPDVQIERGEIVRFVNQNGQVEKALINVLRGKTAYAGEIQIDGRKVVIRNERDAMNERIAYLPMYTAPGTLHNHLTIEDNFLLLNPKVYTRFGLVNRRLQRFACRQYLKDSDIPLAVLGFYPEILDSHQRNELNLIRLRAMKPRIVLLDDSFINCDTIMKSRIFLFIQEMIQQEACIIAGVLTDMDREQLEIRDIPV